MYIIFSAVQELTYEFFSCQISCKNLYLSIISTVNVTHSAMFLWYIVNLMKRYMYIIFYKSNNNICYLFHGIYNIVTFIDKIADLHLLKTIVFFKKNNKFQYNTIETNCVSKLNYFLYMPYGLRIKELHFYAIS